MRWAVVASVVAFVGGLAVGYVDGRHTAHGTEGNDTIREVVTQTEVKVDTIVRLRPLPYRVWVEQTDTIVLDSCKHIREVAEYCDSTYYARVSGVSARLDEIRVYPKTVYRTETRTNYVTQKSSRWGFGIQGGYGITPKGFQPYVGVGVSWRLW